MWKKKAQPANSKPVKKVVEQLYRCQESARFPSRIPQRCVQQGRTPQRVAIPPSEPAPRPNSASLLENEPRQSKRSDNTEKKKIWIPATKVHPQLIDQRTPISDRNKKPIITPQSPQGKKTCNEPSVQGNKNNKPLIVVPVTKRQPQKPASEQKNREQATINKSEEGEIVMNINDYEDGIKSKESSPNLKLEWDGRITEYEKTKSELQEKQTIMMQQYANLRLVHEKMKNKNDHVKLPSPEDLKVLNIANLSPEQLLKLCAATEEHFLNNDLICMDVPVDVNKLYSLAGNLLGTCQDTFVKRQEIIDWLDSLLKTYPEKKGIKMKTLVSKINEISKENNTLKSSLEDMKTNFLEEVDDITECLRKGMNHTMGLQLKNEELTYELSELNAQNADLRKQLHAAESHKSYGNKFKIEELERLLQEEKYKNSVVNERLSRADAQFKSAAKRSQQLEEALKKAREQVSSLDKTVKELRDQNERIQFDFNKELNRFTESIRENTAQIEQIAEAREKLHTEKEELEKRLEDLTHEYQISIEQMVKELHLTQGKVVETEMKYKHELDEKKNLEMKVESLHTKLLESEIQCKEIFKELHGRDEDLCKVQALQEELNALKIELEKVKCEAENYKNKLQQQDEAFKDIEQSLDENLKAEENLKSELRNRDKYILELKRKQSMLEKDLQNSASKTNLYKQQLTSLENNLKFLREDLGEFENFNELYDKIHQQRAKSQEVTLRNEQLLEELEKRTADVKEYEKSIQAQEQIIKQKDELLEIMHKKEVEQTTIIKNLQNHLDVRTREENVLYQKLNKKIAEIECLEANLENSKQQISQQEKKAKTLEEETKQANLQRSIDLDIINGLVAKLEKYEACFIEADQDSDMPENAVDTLINILEDEIRSPLSILKTSFSKNSEFTVNKSVQEKTNKLNQNHSRNQEQTLRGLKEKQNVPTKFSADNNNHYKSKFLPKNIKQVESETQKRSYDMQRRSYTSSSEYGCRRPVPSTTSYDEAMFLGCNSRSGTEKLSKMFKFASHRINN